MRNSLHFETTSFMSSVGAVVTVSASLLNGFIINLIRHIYTSLVPSKKYEKFNVTYCMQKKTKKNLMWEEILLIHLTWYYATAMQSSRMLNFIAL
jgi:hypothetical protein